MSNEADHLLEVLQRIAFMDPRVQCQYFKLRDEMIVSPYEGLFAIISCYKAEDIFELMEKYDEEMKKEIDRENMKKLKAIADGIGWNKMNELLGRLKEGENVEP